MAVADLVDPTWEPFGAVPTMRGLREVGGMPAALLGEMEEATEDETGASSVWLSWLMVLVGGVVVVGWWQRESEWERAL